MVICFLAYCFTPANQSRAEYPSDQQELEFTIETVSGYQLLLCHCRDNRSWCSESHWRQISCMTESPELSAARITSCTNGAAFTSSSFTAWRYAARSLLHWRYAFIYRERERKACEWEQESVWGEKTEKERIHTLFSGLLDSRIKPSSSLA